MATNDNVRFLVDRAGNKVAVVLDHQTYEALIQRLEDLEDMQEARDYEARKADGSLTADEAEQVPFERAVEEIEAAWAKMEEEAEAPTS